MDFTLTDISQFIALVTAITAPVASVVVYFNKKVLSRLNSLERWNENQQKDINSCLDEQRLLLQGVLSCLKALEEQGDCEVHSAINEIEVYTIEKAHNGKSRRA